MIPKCSNLYRLETLECVFQAKFGTHDYSMYDYDQCFDGAATAFANVLNALEANPRRIGFQDETEEDDCDVTTEEDDWPPVSHSFHDAIAT